MKLRYKKREDINGQILNQVDQSEFSENNIYVGKERGEESVEVEPRKRKTQQTSEKIDQFLDNVDTPQYSKKKKILKFRYGKE